MLELKNHIFYENKQVVKPVYVIPKPSFPTEPKKVVNPSLNENGKHKPKKKVPKGQTTFLNLPNN